MLIKNISILTCIFVLICGTIQFLIIRSEDKQIEATFIEKLELKQRQVERFFEIYELIAKQSEYNIYLKDLFLETTERDQINGNERYESVLKEFKAISNAYEAISTVWAADVDGSFFIEDNGYISDPDWNINERTWYKRGKDKEEVYVTEPYVAASNGEEVVSVINPIIHENGRALGVFALDLNYEYLSDTLEDINKVGGGHMMLMSGDETIIFSDESENIIKNISEIQFESDIKKEILKKDKVLVRGQTPEKYLLYSIEISVPDWRLIGYSQEDLIPSSHSERNDYYELALAFALLLLFISLMLALVNRYFGAIKTRRITDFDEMTGIYNARGLSCAVEEILQDEILYQYYYSAFSVRKINILNEMLGFDRVNALFSHIAKCLREEVIQEECFGRVAGNKFGFFFKAEDVESARERLECLNKKIVSFDFSKEKNHSLQLEIGVFELIGETNFEKIQSYTDFTLEVGQRGASYESDITFYDEKFRDRHTYEKELENDMERAIENDEFMIYLQGKYNLHTGDLSSAEVLVRWNHSIKGIINPVEFIPLFEKNGFIIKLDYMVFEKACKLLRKWIDEGIRPVPLAVNLSRIHLDDPTVVDYYVKILDKYKIPAKLVQVELTESALSENLENLIEIVKKFKAKQISVAIDDFGTGYSTLSTLKELNFDTLKIDREFFVNMNNNDRGKAIVRSIIVMAKELSLETVSEGIETEDQIEFLKEVNGDLVQGFYFSRPLATDIFEEKIMGRGK